MLCFWYFIFRQPMQHDVRWCSCSVVTPWRVRRLTSMHQLWWTRCWWAPRRIWCLSALCLEESWNGSLFWRLLRYFSNGDPTLKFAEQIKTHVFACAHLNAHQKNNKPRCQLTLWLGLGAGVLPKACPISMAYKIYCLFIQCVHA